MFGETFGRIIGYATILREHVLNYMRTYCPPYVSEVVHIDPETRTIQPIYRAREYWYSWSLAHTGNMFAFSDEGYYAITVWNPWHGKYRWYFFHATTLQKIFGIMSLRFWWALSDMGIVMSLATYDLLMGHTKTIFSITMEQKDITKRIQPYLWCLEHDPMITAEALCLLVFYLQGDCPKKNDCNRVVITDFDLEEYEVTGDQKLLHWKK